MKQASFTVKHKGIGYCANHLTVGVRSTEDGMISTLSFICSGVMTTLDAADVEVVEFHATGAQHCNSCDNSVYNLVGAGIHK